MKKIITKAVTEAIACILGLMTRVLLYGKRNPQAMARLGQIYGLVQQCAHEATAARLRNKYDIHPTAVWDTDTVLYGAGKILIGEHTYIGRDSFVVSHPAQARIIIGKECAISHSVHIRTANYQTNMHFKDALTAPSDWNDIIIGNHVWIGAHAVITGGVTIGNNSVIGANAVVTHDIPPNTICGGVPARPIRSKPKPAQRTVN